MPQSRAAIQVLEKRCRKSRPQLVQNSAAVPRSQHQKNVPRPSLSITLTPNQNRWSDKMFEYLVLGKAIGKFGN